MNRKLVLLLCATCLCAGCTLDTECRPGMSKCANSDGEKAVLQYCYNEFWGDPLTFNQSCNVEGTQLGNCLNGEVRCNDGNEIRCENGAEVSFSCNGKGCRLDEISCNECMGNGIVCEDDAIRSCVNGRLELIENCEFGCDSERLECLICHDDSVQCADTMNVQKCSENKWDAFQICPEGTVCSRGECKSECDEADILCAEGAIMVCSEGRWQTKSECDTHFCKTNRECAECSENEERCSNDTSASGVYRQCLSGRFHEFECRNSLKQAVSCNDNRCGGCLNGSKKCEKDSIYVCENGLWIKSEDCALGCVAGDDGCNQNGECKPGVSRCENGSVQVCYQGVWSARSLCENGCDSQGVKCLVKTAGSECSSGTKCSGNTIYTCTNGYWRNTGTTCPYGCNGNQCAECGNGAKKCENNKVYTCSNGSWGAGSACSYGCNGTSCASQPTCVNGNWRCVSGALQKCVNSNWNGQGTSKCDGGTKYSCSGGTLNKNSCSYGCCKSAESCRSTGTDSC